MYFHSKFENNTNSLNVRTRKHADFAYLFVLYIRAGNCGEDSLSLRCESLKISLYFSRYACTRKVEFQNYISRRAHLTCELHIRKPQKALTYQQVLSLMRLGDDKGRGG